MEEMSPNTKLEIAIEILAAKIAKEAREKEYDLSDKKIIELLKERDEMYSGNTEVIKKIIEEYGKEIKNSYNEIKEEE